MLGREPDHGRGIKVFTSNEHSVADMICTSDRGLAIAFPSKYLLSILYLQASFPGLLQLHCGI